MHKEEWDFSQQSNGLERTNPFVSRHDSNEMVRLKSGSITITFKGKDSFKKIGIGVMLLGAIAVFGLCCAILGSHYFKEKLDETVEDTPSVKPIPTPSPVSVSNLSPDVDKVADKAPVVNSSISQVEFTPLIFNHGVFSSLAVPGRTITVKDGNKILLKGIRALSSGVYSFEVPAGTKLKIVFNKISKVVPCPKRFQDNVPSDHQGITVNGGIFKIQRIFYSGLTCVSALPKNFSSPATPAQQPTIPVTTQAMVSQDALPTKE